MHHRQGCSPRLQIDCNLGPILIGSSGEVCTWKGSANPMPYRGEV